jgi:DNA-binding PadR family transcriptional regulator
MLRHLEKQGLVESRWDTQTTGPARRIYSVTRAGMDLLTETIASLDAAVTSLRNLADRLKELNAGVTTPD